MLKSLQPSQLMNVSVIVIDSDDDNEQQPIQRQQQQRALVTPASLAAAAAIKARAVVPQPPPQHANYAGSLQSVKLGGFVPLNCTVTTAAANAHSRRFKETPRGRKSTGGLCVSSAMRQLASPPTPPPTPPVKLQAVVSNGRLVPSPSPAKPLPPAATYESVIENENNYIDYTEYFYCREFDPTESVTSSAAAAPITQGPFTYACCVCPARLPSAHLAAEHILEHLLSARIQRASLSAHTRCPRCLRSFATPARMQRHLSRAHPTSQPDESALVCRVCELHFDTDAQLASHLHCAHPPRDMPYRCELCAHRSSCHADVIRHFYSFHATSGELLCQFCLKVFRFQSGPGQSATQSLSSYYTHLRAHLADQCGSDGDANSNACSRCRLHFLSRRNLRRHADSDHNGKSFNLFELTAPAASTAANSAAAAAAIRSLNAAPASRLCGLAQLKYRVRRQQSCLECQRPMCLTGHYHREFLCPACRYVTCCGDAFARHERRHRAGVAGPSALTKSASRPALGEVGVGAGNSKSAYALYCRCGFVTADGDAMARHVAVGCRVSSGVSRGCSSASAGATQRWQGYSSVRLIRRARHRKTRQLRRQQRLRNALKPAAAQDGAAGPIKVPFEAVMADLAVPSGVPLLESVGLGKRIVAI